MKRLVITAYLLACGPAAADEAWHLTAEVLTDVPVQVGARATVEGPHRLRAGTSLGVMPESYVSTINETALAYDLYPQATATLIEAVLQDSLIWRTHAGWRPFAKRGLYFELGYGLARVSGNSVGQEVVATAAGLDAPRDAGRALRFEASASLHMLDVEIGWVWALPANLQLRTAIGGAFTLASSATINREFDTVFTPAWDAFEGAGERYLVDMFDTYAHTATLTVAIGYQIF